MRLTFIKRFATLALTRRLKLPIWKSGSVSHTRACLATYLERAIYTAHGHKLRFFALAGFMTKGSPATAAGKYMVSLSNHPP
jgi:hypothetical protein